MLRGSARVGVAYLIGQILSRSWGKRRACHPCGFVNVFSNVLAFERYCYRASTARVLDRRCRPLHLFQAQMAVTWRVRLHMGDRAMFSFSNLHQAFFLRGDLDVQWLAFHGLKIAVLEFGWQAKWWQSSASFCQILVQSHAQRWKFRANCSPAPNAGFVGGKLA